MRANKLQQNYVQLFKSNTTRNITSAMRSMDFHTDVVLIYKNRLSCEIRRWHDWGAGTIMLEYFNRVMYWLYNADSTQWFQHRERPEEYIYIYIYTYIYIYIWTDLAHIITLWQQLLCSPTAEHYRHILLHCFPADCIFQALHAVACSMHSSWSASIWSRDGRLSTCLHTPRWQKDVHQTVMRFPLKG